ncbi:MAG: 4-(cytidine 5'-diphospho)-2-C-methyl-D-erythritol kinase [Armatimonadetes bacterium]|nr:4-(cytidine 5'-diphospho)-2-C-methyl-D-erythritol kinase [Armatimonadota bacterium]
MIVHCPAKINTFLSVGPPDGSGYHAIRTVMQAVSLQDKLIIQRASRDSFHCTSPEVPADNTVTKAWRLAREYVGLPNLEVTLEKHIPIKSGLGGGSSDAAGLLRALSVLTGGMFSHREAIEVATAVGMDVPFFLAGGHCRAEGHGERVSPMPDIERTWLLIAMPLAEVSSAGAYAQLDGRSAASLKEFPDSVWSTDNDFASIAPEASRRAIEDMRRCGADCAGLTGSGAAVFGVFEGQTSARKGQIAWKHTSSAPTWLCHTLSREESLWMS